MSVIFVQKVFVRNQNHPPRTLLELKVPNFFYVYLRVSTEDKGQDEGLQLQPCLDYGQTHNLGDPIIFRERASAWQRHARPVFEDMLARASKENVQHIVVWRFDRISRRRLDFLKIWAECSLRGIKIHSITETFVESLEALNQLPKPWDDIIGKMVFGLILNIIGWLAEEESRKKSENVRNTYQNKKKKADDSGVKLKWGRPVSVRDSTLIYDLRSEGLTMRQIAAELKISPALVHKILKQKKVFGV